MEGGGRKMARKAQPNCTLRCILGAGPGASTLLLAGRCGGLRPARPTASRCWRWRRRTDPTRSGSARDASTASSTMASAARGLTTSIVPVPGVLGRSRTRRLQLGTPASASGSARVAGSGTWAGTCTRWVRITRRSSRATSFAGRAPSVTAFSSGAPPSFDPGSFGTPTLFRGRGAPRCGRVGATLTGRGGDAEGANPSSPVSRL